MKFVQFRAISLVESRTPHGVRGLKYDIHVITVGQDGVAPLTGCVD